MSASSSPSPVAGSARDGRSAEGGGSNTPLIAPPPKIKLLQCRVDGLTLAYRIERDCPRVLQALELAASSESGAAVFTVGQLTLAVKSSRVPGVLSFESGDVTGRLDVQEQHGYYVQVRPRASYLATHTLSEVLQLGDQLATMFGPVVKVRVRRLDLCADIGGWEIGKTASSAWLMQRRASLKGYRQVDHKVGVKRTGVTICAGNSLMLRAYDKVAELGKQDREVKRELEEGIWSKAGWSPGEAVTRVEFQLRSAALASLGMRDDLGALQAKLDGLWSYCTQKWVRLIEPGSASRRERCKLDPRWSVVRSAVFTRAAAPAERRRVKHGVNVHQLLGTQLSYLARRGMLPDARSLLRSVSGPCVDLEHQRATTRALLRELFDRACAQAEADLELRHGVMVAGQYLVEHLAVAAASRFCQGEGPVVHEQGAPDATSPPTSRTALDGEASREATARQAADDLPAQPPREPAGRSAARALGTLPQERDRALRARAAAAQ